MATCTIAIAINPKPANAPIVLAELLVAMDQLFQTIKRHRRF